jgi:hypothetical protein
MSATALPATGVRPADWQPCSDRSLERDDPLAGTSGFGERWFLVEVESSWGRHALAQSRLDPALAHTLVKRVERAGMRPLAIRRPAVRADIRRRQDVWRWAVVDSRQGNEAVAWGAVDNPEALVEVPLDGSTGTPSGEPIICVCTHGRHDQCCAVKGRAALAPIAAAFPSLTWECSHLGGDRFAATMMIFPHALHFGRVTPDAAVAIVDSYLSGTIDAGHFRGRASQPNVVQAAEAYARAALGDDRLDAIRPLDHGTQRGGEHGGPGAWTVNFAYQDSTVAVELQETRSAPLLSTCTATVPVSVRQFALDAVRR